MKKIIFIFIIITILISPIFSEKAGNNLLEEVKPEAQVKIIDKPQDEGTHVYVKFKPLNKPEEIKYYLLEVYNKKADSEELVSSFKIESISFILLSQTPLKTIRFNFSFDIFFIFEIICSTVSIQVGVPSFGDLIIIVMSSPSLLYSILLYSIFILYPFP